MVVGSIVFVSRVCWVMLSTKSVWSAGYCLYIESLSEEGFELPLYFIFSAAFELTLLVRLILLTLLIALVRLLYASVVFSQGAYMSYASICTQVGT